ncbi:MAG: UbiD family decarboxylase [Dehalococcoidia bacterium]|nr:UbiD family decarboxylase [Dehalococcoidia bacterium]
MSKDLREFLSLAKKAGPEFYVEVKKPLKPELEKDVLQLKLYKERGLSPVIYCPVIKGSKLPLVSNIFGSYELLGLALGLEPKKATKSQIFHDYLKKKNELKPVKKVPASQAPVKEVILKGKDVDLGVLPLIYHAERNSKKYVPIGQMVCRNPDTGVLNVGVYRHEVKGKDKLGAMFVPDHHAAYHARRYAELGKPMEVAIFIGHHPAVALGSLFKGAMDVNELEVAGGLLGESLRVTKAETVDLPVPADAEIVIEGVLDPKKMTTDGPFSEWEGYYGIELKCYVINITCITMRKDAIYHDLAPSQIEHTMAAALNQAAAVYDAVKAVVPTVKDVYLPHSGRSNIVGYVQIAKRVPGESNRAGIAAVNALSCLKIAVVVDEDIDIYNEDEVIWAIATRTTPDRDITILPRVLGDPLSPTSYDELRQKRGVMITKMVIDATKPLETPFPTVVTPPKDLWQSMKLDDYIK